MLRTGAIRPVIDREYPLAKASDAVRYLEEGHAQGKVIVTVSQLRVVIWRRWQGSSRHMHDREHDIEGYCVHVACVDAKAHDHSGSD